MDDAFRASEAWTKNSTSPCPKQAGGCSQRRPGDRVGKFLLEVKLGQGAFGEVWQAFDTLGPLGHVALKLPDADIPVKLGERWLRDEAAALNKLATNPHPNIVPILDAGVIDDMPYVAFKLIEGGLTLDSYVVQHKLTPRRISHLTAELADGLAHAHRYGVVHRDIKPKNNQADRGRQRRGFP